MLILRSAHSERAARRDPGVHAQRRDHLPVGEPPAHAFRKRDGAPAQDVAHGHAEHPGTVDALHQQRHASERDTAAVGGTVAVPTDRAVGDGETASVGGTTAGERRREGRRGNGNAGLNVDQ